MEQQNQWAEKRVFLLRSGLIILWYYATSLMISGMLYARLKDVALYTAYITRNSNKIMIATYLMLFMGVWIFDTHKEQFLAALTKWNIVQMMKYIMMGLVAYLVCTMITSALIIFFPDYEGISAPFSDGKFLLSFMSTVILPAIVEEYIFRHKLQGYFKSALNVPVAIICQAVLFGMVHSYVIQKIYAFILGIFFGVIDEKEKSIQPSMMMHMVINGVGWYIGCFLA